MTLTETLTLTSSTMTMTLTRPNMTMTMTKPLTRPPSGRGGQSCSAKSLGSDAEQQLEPFQVERANISQISQIPYIGNKTTQNLLSNLIHRNFGTWSYEGGHIVRGLWDILGAMPSQELEECKYDAFLALKWILPLESDTANGKTLCLIKMCIC